MVSGWVGGRFAGRSLCRKLIIGKDIGWRLARTLVGGWRGKMSWCDLDLTFDLAVVTLTYIKSCLDYIWETVRCRKLILGKGIGWGCRCATSRCNLDFTFDLAIETLSLESLSGLYLRNRKVSEVDTLKGHWLGIV